MAIVWTEIATIDSEQTFTNKTYDANGTGNVLSNIDNYFIFNVVLIH